jgi:hypothetical protein
MGFFLIKKDWYVLGIFSFPVGIKESNEAELLAVIKASEYLHL